MAFNEAIMETVLNHLESISGFVSAYIYLGNGETLLSKSKKEMSDVNIGALAVELYRAAKVISDRMGLGKADFVEVHTDSHIFIHTCIIPGHSAMAAIITKDGNLGLMKYELSESAKRLLPEFQSI